MKKILVVDDEELIRDLLVSLLERNYDTLTAKNGSEALNIIRANSDLGLILMDTDMPNSKGYDICKQLRKEGHKEIIIGMSGNAGEEYQKKWQEAGSNDFIEKPFSIFSISEKVKSYLGE